MSSSVFDEKGLTLYRSDYLPTPESISNPFFASAASNIGISPSDVSSVPRKNSVARTPSTARDASLGSGNVSGPADNSKQALLAHEKKRRRRESHNAVERRRRDNINEKISELATLIPECLMDPNGA